MESPRKTFRCEFLGCKVNQYDAERARRHLITHGYQEADERAAVLLLASCTVTSNAARRGRQAIRSVLRKNPDAHVAVLGCFTPEDRRQYEALAREVTFLPSATSENFLEELARVTPGPPDPEPPAPRKVRPRRTRAYLKVEDGCDLSCTFCIIPSVRGKARSRGVDAVRRELQGLVEAGTREVVLTGVHLGHYGRRAEAGLATLVETLLNVDGDWRLRLSSLEVTELSAALLELLRSHPRLVPHLHLPLQSGSERVLRAMRRPYTARRFRETVARIRDRLDRPALTTDVIVGFPGETPDDFEATRELCREASFSKIHVFPYSPRTGTVAAGLPGIVPGEEVRRRKQRLFEVERQSRRRSLEAEVGRTVVVLAEQRQPDGVLVGYDERYHRTEVHAPTSPADVGRLVRVRVREVSEDRLRGVAEAGQPAGAP